jgi:CheY-specific phosphatase CheX
VSTHTSTSTSQYAELLESELPRVLNEVICGLLGENDNAETVHAASASQSFLSCSVNIRGGFAGEVIVSATPPLAARIAEKMFEDELEGAPTQQDARDALREVSNIVAGNLKPLFGENNQLGLPEDEAQSHSSHSGELATCTLEIPAGVLRVVVYATL